MSRKKVCSIFCKANFANFEKGFESNLSLTLHYFHVLLLLSADKGSSWELIGLAIWSFNFQIPHFPALRFGSSF